MAGDDRRAETTVEVDGHAVFVQGDPLGRAGEAPVLYLHGVPTTSDDWRPFLARTGGLAIDLPGFGRSAKRGDFDHSIAGYDRFLERFLDQLGVERVRLALHDWGAVGLAFAQRCPERVDRIAIINAVPFLPGYRWHSIARMWRTPLLGELVMGTTTRRTARLLVRLQRAVPRGGDDPLENAWPHFDHGTQRAILRLYRSAPEPALAAAGAGLGGLNAPALVAWGERDPYFPAVFGEAYARALPHARHLPLPDAGHWPWLDRPDLIETVASFMAEDTPGNGIG